MAVSTVQKSNVSGSIQLAIGVSTLDLLYDRGDVAIGPLQARLNSVNAVARRGRFLGLVHGDRIYPTINFSAWITQFSEATGTGDLIDFVLNKDAYSALVSLGGANTPYTFDLSYTVEGTDFGDAADHTFTCHDVHAQLNFTESAEGLQLAFSGTMYGEFTGDIDIDEIA